MFYVFDAGVFPGTHGPIHWVGTIVLGDAGAEKSSDVPPTSAARDEAANR
jgi:hypothetical protein